MTFRKIALPLIRRGIPVIPVQPGEKRCVLPQWQGLASTIPSQIEFWNQENPEYNVGCVAQPEGIVILDCDVKGLHKRIVQETGQDFPETLIVRSAGKGCLHFYFKQTDRSRELGNRAKAETFDLQSKNKYVVGPGSVLAETGKTYEIVQDAEIADFHDWLGEWIEKEASRSPQPEGFEFSSTEDDFDIEDMLAHYDLEFVQMGDWYDCNSRPVLIGSASFCA